MARCREHRLTPEAVEAVGRAARELRARADEALKSANPGYQAEGRRFAEGLDRQARTLSAYIEDLLAELDADRGATVGELVGLLRRYNLHFGPAVVAAARKNEQVPW